MIVPANYTSVTVGGQTFLPGQEIPDDLAKLAGLTPPAAPTKAPPSGNP